MKHLPTFALLWLSSSAIAAEPDKGPTQHHRINDAGQVGIDLTVPAVSTWGARFDTEGGRVGDLPLHNSMVFQFAPSVGIIDGLEIGGALPLVQNTAGRLGDPDRTRFGLGDLSLHAGGEARLDHVDIGGTVRVKLASGDTATGNGNPARALGSGQPDLDVIVHFTRWSGDVLVDGEAGYLVRFEGLKNMGNAEFDYKPGDVFHLETGVTAWNSGRYGAGLHALYHSAQPELWEKGGGLEAIGDGSALTSVVVRFVVRAADILDLELATRSNNIGSSLSVVETGIPLFGRNIDVVTGVPVQFNARFRI